MRGLEKCPTCGHVLSVERRPLTKRQLQVLALIRSHVSSHGVSPTLRELARALDVRSDGTVHELLSALEAKGYIRREFNCERGISLLPEPAEMA